MKLLGLASLLLALGFLAGAKGRYTVQPEGERGPFGRTLFYGVVGVGFAVVALTLLPQAGH